MKRVLDNELIASVFENTTNIKCEAKAVNTKRCHYQLLLYKLHARLIWECEEKIGTGQSAAPDFRSAPSKSVPE